MGAAIVVGLVVAVVGGILVAVLVRSFGIGEPKAAVVTVTETVTQEAEAPPVNTVTVTTPPDTSSGGADPVTEQQPDPNVDAGGENSQASIDSKTIRQATIEISDAYKVGAGLYKKYFPSYSVLVMTDAGEIKKGCYVTYTIADANGKTLVKSRQKCDETVYTSNRHEYQVPYGTYSIRADISTDWGQSKVVTVQFTIVGE